MHAHLIEHLDHCGNGVADNHHVSIIQHRRPYLVLYGVWTSDMFDKPDLGGCLVDQALPLPYVPMLILTSEDLCTRLDRHEHKLGWMRVLDMAII